jgi:hypothetical protein
MLMNKNWSYTVLFSLGLVLALSGCNGFMSGRLKFTTTKLTELKKEKNAWEDQRIDTYYLQLTHHQGSQLYATMAEIRGNRQSYLAGDAVPVPITPDPFPFPPLAETVRDLYDALERIWDKNDDIYILFNSGNHSPRYIQITNYLGSGTDYILKAKMRMSYENDVLAKDFNWVLFDTEKAAWEAQGIRSYSYVRHTQSDAENSSLKVIVLPDRAPIFEFLGYGVVEPPEDFDGTSFYITLSQLFGEIQHRIKEAASSKLNTSERIIIRYNTRYHYPEYFVSYIDEINIGGGRYSIEITDFVVLDN